MFGAPVRWEIHAIFARVLPFGDTYTPYGATECLPVSLISGSEILKQHQLQMVQGAGTCIGPPVSGCQVKIIKTSDIPEHQLQEMPIGQIGEICVSGPQVTPAYFELEEETRLAKILTEDQSLWHRMGDNGRLDAEGNLWFLGRKAHRVELPDQTHYPLAVESIFNQHPAVRRSALIKLFEDEKTYLAVVIERWDGAISFAQNFAIELFNLAQTSPHTREVACLFIHPGFPTDVRHNIKIDRLKLAVWAAKKGKGVWVSEPRTKTVESFI